MIRNATNADLPNIVNCHQICFPNSFSTILGGNKGILLQKYYFEYLKKVPELFKVATDENNKIIGFCMGYYCDDNNYTNNFFKNNFLSIAIRMFFLLISANKKAWKKIFPRKKLICEIKKSDYCVIDENKKGDLLSICVLPNFRGSGLAKSLVEAFEQELITYGKSYSQLTVEIENKRGIAFYEKIGYLTYKEIINEKICMYKKINT